MLIPSWIHNFFRKKSAFSNCNQRSGPRILPLSEGDRLLTVGHAGSGKTTVLKASIALSAARSKPVRVFVVTEHPSDWKDIAGASLTTFAVAPRSRSRYLYEVASAMMLARKVPIDNLVVLVLDDADGYVGDLLAVLDTVPASYQVVVTRQGLVHSHMDFKHSDSDLVKRFHRIALFRTQMTGTTSCIEYARPGLPPKVLEAARDFLPGEFVLV